MAHRSNKRCSAAGWACSRQWIPIAFLLCFISYVSCHRLMLEEHDVTEATAGSPTAAPGTAPERWDPNASRPLLASSSTCTRIRVVNKWVEDVQLRIAAVSNYDWDGVSRPDENLQGRIIQAGSDLTEREEVNASAVPHFQLTAVIMSTNEDWFTARVGASWGETGMRPFTEWLAFGSPHVHPEAFPMDYTSDLPYVYQTFSVRIAQDQEVFSFEWWSC